MIDLDLSWEQAALLTGGLAVGAAVLLRQNRPRLAATGIFVRESALICGLFTLWQFAGTSSRVGHIGAYSRGHWLWDAERWLRLPNETSVQAPFLSHPLLIQILNFYYDILHFPVLIGCMIWLFIAHRDRYPRFRTTLVAFTGACLLIQLIPVAPPRLIAGSGMVDTALRYGQSVYDPHAGFEANQFSAMPSVHVGWAILVAIGIIGAARTRWRWLAVLYPAATMLVVGVTANHYWLDGIAAGLIIVIVLPVQAGLRHLWATRRSRGQARPLAPIPQSRTETATESEPFAPSLTGPDLARTPRPEDTGQ